MVSPLLLVLSQVLMRIVVWILFSCKKSSVTLVAQNLYFPSKVFVLYGSDSIGSA